VLTLGFKKVFNIIKPAMERQKKAGFAYMFNMVIAWAVGLSLPFVTGLYIDSLLVDSDMDIVMIFAMVFLGMYILRIIINFFQAIVGQMFNSMLQHMMMMGSVRHILKSRYSKYHNADTSTIMAKVHDDGQVFSFFFSNNCSLVIEIITLIASIILLFVVDIPIGLIMLGAMPLYFLIYLVFRKKLYKKHEAYRKSGAKYFSKRAEQLNRIGFIKRNELAEDMQARADKAFYDNRKTAIGVAIINFFFQNAGEITSALFHVAILIFGGYRVINNEISIGFFTMIMLYFGMVMTSCKNFFLFAGTYQQSILAAERTREILDNPIDKTGDIKPEHIKELKLQDLSLSYGDNKVFSEINHSFKIGRIYAICGENGSGKTSLLNCIMGMYLDLISGQILFDGTPIDKLDMAYMRRNRISFVEQLPEFLNMSLEEFLTFGIEQTEVVQKTKQELIDIFDLGKFDLSTPIAESGSNFSGGEKQKIAITRALSKNSAIAILDEPTSALDDASVDILVDVLNRQKSSRITLVISHDHRILQLCDEHWHIAH